MKAKAGFFVLGLILFLLVAFALHYAGFSAPMYYDSPLLQENEHLLLTEGFRGAMKIFSSRPIAMASFYGSYLVHGMAPWWFRATNVVILACTALMVTVVAYFLLKMPLLNGPTTTWDRMWAALFAGALFLVHPVQVFLVLYIWQRMALLACFFYFASLALYLATRTGRLRPWWLGYVLCLLSFLAGAGSKENTVTLPFVFMLTEFAFFAEPPATRVKRVVFPGVCLLLAILMLSHLQQPHGSQAHVSGIRDTVAMYYKESGLSVGQVILLEVRLVFRYLAIALAPFPSLLHIITPQEIDQARIYAPTTFAAVGGILLLAFIGLVLLRRRPISGFGILFFMGNFVPEAILVPQYLFFVYRVALPMVGLVLVVVDVGLAILQQVKGTKLERLVRVTAAVVSVATLGALATVTVSKAIRWGEPVLLWREVFDQLPPDIDRLERRPTVNVLNNFGIVLQRSGFATDSIRYFQKSLEVDPHNVRTLILLGKTHIRLGQYKEAERPIRKALELLPNYPEALMGLAIVRKHEGRLEDALELAKQATNLVPTNAGYHNDLGAILLQLGRTEDARWHFAKASSLRSDLAVPHFYLGKISMGEGRLSEAEKSFRRVLELKPDHFRARHDLAVVLMNQGRLEEAAGHLRQALVVNPHDPVIRESLERVLQELGKTSSRHVQ